MPCLGPDPAEDYRSEMHAATRAGCELAKALRQVSTLAFRSLSTQTQIWVEKHDKLDKERAKEEREDKLRAKLRAAALAKLTPAERKAIRRG